MSTILTYLKYWLTSQKLDKLCSIKPSEFQHIYPILINVFELQDKVTGEFEANKSKIVILLTAKVYTDVFGVYSFKKIIPSSFINLYAFFSHMYIDKNNADYFAIGLYKKSPNIFVVGSLFATKCISHVFSQFQQIQDMSFFQIYANDFYPGFTFKSEEEQEDCLASTFDCLLTITTEHILVHKEKDQEYVLLPSFHPKYREYLYKKYNEIYKQFSVIYEKEKEEYDYLRKHQIQDPLLIYKQGLVSTYHSLDKYLRELVDFFNPPS